MNKKYYKTNQNVEYKNGSMHSSGDSARHFENTKFLNHTGSELIQPDTNNSILNPVPQDPRQKTSLSFH